MRRLILPVALLTCATLAYAQLQPSPASRDPEIHDADTLAWWHTTETLSGDDMEGRDTGSAAYQRAADLVVRRFREAGLRPAGNDRRGSFFQTVPMHQVQVESIGTRFTLLRPGAAPVPLPFLEQITISANAALAPDTAAPLTFRGYCGKDAMQGVAGKIVLCFGTQQRNLPSAAERMANARAGGAVGIVTIDNPYFTLEPPRWPYAYARSVTLGTGTSASTQAPILTMRVGQPAYAMMLAGSGQDSVGILRDGGAGRPLPSFDLPSRLHVTLNISQKDISSPNVLAVLPGSDPTLRAQYIALSAHLDGYGFGTSVGADNLYNGALDDAAYVALLLQFADDVHAGRLAPPKRSILLCAFTGEEKGLLGSTWYVHHPTVPLAETMADINLDQLRPLFPLRILTALAVDDTTLGATARQVGTPMGIEIRADREPERGLLRRADHWPFLEAGVPAIGFIFGYDPGTDAEQRYREWYQTRYHRPQDDITQPVDFEAAAKFDTFFYSLVEALADAPAAPAFTANAPYPQRH
jgi:hypothetical protein